MNIYCCYTPSHKPIYWRYFQKSVCFDNSLVAKQLPEFGSGKYKNQMWQEATRQKTEMIIEIIDYGLDDIFIFSDVDIQFFGPITDLVTKAIIGHDIVLQQDPSAKYELMYCTGFMAIRLSNKIKKFFESILELMDERQELDDQDAFNLLAREPHDLKLGTFDPKIVWSHRKMWRAGQEIEFPDEMLIHHANWTSSIEDKIAQLELILKMYYERFGPGFLQERTTAFRDRSIP